MVFMYQGQSLSGGGSGADENVKQVPTSSGSNYEVLFSGGANNTEDTNYARKTNAFKYSPDTQIMHLGFTANNGNTGISLDGLTGSIKSNLNSTEFVEIGQYGHSNAVFYKYKDGVAYDLAIDSSDIAIIQGPLWDGDTTSLKNAIRLTAKKSNISEEFDIFNAYAVGDYCIKDNILYICTTAVTGDGSNFNPSDWTATAVDTELKSKANKSEAISGITRSGTTFTATRANGTTFTFSQQDNNTTYSFATGDSNGQIKVTPSGGKAQNVSVKGLGSRAFDSTTYVPASGGTFTGGVTFNSTPKIKSGINIGLDAYSAGSTTQTGALELYNGNYVLIDFHWKYSSSDWTYRIVQHAADTLEFYGHDVNTWGTLKAKAFSVQSSIHVKENIEDITEEEACKLLQLRPVSFDYKNSETKNQRGLIAEEVLEIYPEMVEIPEGYTEFDPSDPSIAPSIDYSKFVPYLIKMIQIQEKRISELESKLN